MEEIRKLEKKKNLSIENDDGFFAISCDKGNFDLNTYFDTSVIYLDEDEFPTLERAYAIVEATYPNSEKAYSFLCLDEDVEIGDICIEEKRGQEIQVKEKRLLYFDELPFPLDAYTKCAKKREN